MKVLTFGVVKDVIGKTEFEVSNVTSTSSLKEKLEADYPALKNISYAMAVDKKMVTASTVLTDDATVALLPPFSGG
jgi:molybdopterin converting factor small subunit